MTLSTVRPETQTIKLTISLAPRTKKNHGMVLKHSKRGRIVLPSKAWREWVTLATIRTTVGEFLNVRGKTYAKPDCGCHGAILWQPLDQPMNLRAHFYRDAERGDLTGYLQGLCDLLEKRGIIANDALIVQSDGTRLFLDRDNPRTELWLEPVNG